MASIRLPPVAAVSPGAKTSSPSANKPGWFGISQSPKLDSQRNQRDHWSRRDRRWANAVAFEGIVDQTSQIFHGGSFRRQLSRARAASARMQTPAREGTAIF